MIPSDFYFQLCYTPDSLTATDNYFMITPKEYFDSEGGLSDESGVADDIVPDGFYELQESTYEYDGDALEGRGMLLSLGFIEIDFGFEDCEPYPGIQDVGNIPNRPLSKKIIVAPKKSKDELLKIMMDAIEAEDFEKAAEIRDELKLREKK